MSYWLEVCCFDWPQPRWPLFTCTRCCPDMCHMCSKNATYMWHVGVTHMGHVLNTFSTHFPVNLTITITWTCSMCVLCMHHIWHMWDVTTCVTHQVGHICHIFSTHIAHIYCSNWTIQSDEHGPILGDYITSLQHVRCSYMAHMCNTSDGTYMAHIYNTYYTHLLL